MVFFVKQAELNPIENSQSDLIMESDKKENEKKKEAKIIEIHKKKSINPLDNLLKDLENISKDIEDHFTENIISPELPTDLENQFSETNSEELDST